MKKERKLQRNKEFVLSKNQNEYKLPTLYSNLPIEDDFVSIFDKRKRNPIKLKEIYLIRQKQLRMRSNYMNLLMKNDERQSTEVENRRRFLNNSATRTQLKNFSYLSWNQKQKQDQRYFSLHK